MDQRISFVTLAVADLDASRRFYLDGLGWRAELDVPGEVLMIRVGEHLILSLWDATEFEGEVGAIRGGPGVAPITLAHNVPEPADVDAILDLARRAVAHMSHRLIDDAEGLPQSLRQFGSGLRQRQGVTRPRDKGRPQRRLQGRDLAADRAVGDAKLRRRPRHASMTGERLKGAEGGQGRTRHVILAHKPAPLNRFRRPAKCA